MRPRVVKQVSRQKVEARSEERLDSFHTRRIRVAAHLGSAQDISALKLGCGILLALSPVPGAAFSFLTAQKELLLLAFKMGGRNQPLERCALLQTGEQLIEVPLGSRDD